ESPTLISPCPKELEIIELNISGRSVPIDTNEIPIIKGDIPRADASMAECLTAILLEKNIRNIPTIRIIIANMISYIFQQKF
ncbi:unnamed protein product, partial [marine sediment metagenome]